MLLQIKQKKERKEKIFISFLFAPQYFSEYIMLYSLSAFQRLSLPVRRLVQDYH